MPLNILGLWRDDNIEGVKQLIAKKGDLNLQDAWGRTALMLAIYHGDKNFAETLVKGGADLNLKDKWGLNAQMYAKKYDYGNWWDRVIGELTNKINLNGAENE
jgi:ankyrin repeat protein